MTDYASVFRVCLENNHYVKSCFDLYSISAVTELRLQIMCVNEIDHQLRLQTLDIREGNLTIKGVAENAVTSR